MSFAGFPAGTFAFLRDLSRNNDKRWFDANRERYDRYYVDPAREFVAAIGPRLKKISKTVCFEPKINGSIFRIQRDIRFARDKTPYKDHLDMWFWEGPARGWDTPSFFLRMHHDRLTVGAGMHRLEKKRLEAFRRAVLDAKRGKALESAAAGVLAKGLELGGASRKTVPRGMPADHPRSDYLRYEALYAMRAGKLPKQAKTPECVDWCMEQYTAMAPLYRWLVAL